MNLPDLVDGEAVFLDANILVYYLGPHPIHGKVCSDLVRRIENQAIVGYTSTAVLSDVAHHLMTFEAAVTFGWTSKVVQHLRQDPSAVKQLSKFHQAIAEVPKLGVQIITIPETFIENAAAVSRQTGLLSADALIVAVMRHHGLTQIASNDSDFDTVPGLTRYGLP
jgi:predicted nucleic acid-binding protein